MRLVKTLLAVIDQIVESGILGRDVDCQVFLMNIFLPWVNILCGLILWMCIYVVFFLLLVGVPLLIMFAGNGNAVLNIFVVKLLR